MRESCRLSGGSVVGCLKGRDKYTAIHELIRRAPVFDQLDDRDSFEDAVIAREKICSTGLGHGIALAHGKTPLVNKLFLALGCSRRGIDFGSPDGEPVHFLFIIGNPPEAQDEYLRTVSALAGLMRNSEFREKLSTIKSQARMEGVLRQALGF